MKMNNNLSGFRYTSRLNGEKEIATAGLLVSLSGLLRLYDRR
jgi:hypothetical protein